MAARPYILDDQVGFILRQASQRHTAIFAAHMVHGLTPTQFAALARLAEAGASSQNRLGRLTAMDGATIKGVADRLRKRGLIAAVPDPQDRRRVMLDLTDDGRRVVAEAMAAGREITEATLAPLSAQERAALLDLLAKLA
jgi:DNA-binding MarR family transcriptional regulator